MALSARLDGGLPLRVMSLRDIADLLAPTLGQEKSIEVVNAGANALTIQGPLLTTKDGRRLLEHLAQIKGLVGVAARFAMRRSALVDEAAPPSSVRPVTEKSSPSSDRGPSVREELKALLAASLGSEKAEEEIANVARRLHLGASLDASSAILILEELAKTSGAIGAIARFAKARFLLRK